MKCKTTLWNRANTRQVGECDKEASWRMTLLAEGDAPVVATCDDHLADNLDFTTMNVVWLDETSSAKTCATETELALQEDNDE